MTKKCLFAAAKVTFESLLGSKSHFVWSLVRLLTKRSLRLLFVWEPARPLQGSLGPSGPEMPKKSRKCLSGPPAWDPERVSKKSGRSPKTLSRHFPETLQRLPRLFPRLFGDSFGLPGRRPGRHFRDFFGFSGPPGLRDPCKGQAGSQLLVSFESDK